LERREAGEQGQRLKGEAKIGDAAELGKKAAKPRYRKGS